MPPNLGGKDTQIVRISVYISGFVVDHQPNTFCFLHGEIFDPWKSLKFSRQGFLLSNCLLNFLYSHWGSLLGGFPLVRYHLFFCSVCPGARSEIAQLLFQHQHLLLCMLQRCTMILVSVLFFSAVHGNFESPENHHGCIYDSYLHVRYRKQWVICDTECLGGVACKWLLSTGTLNFDNSSSPKNLICKMPLDSQYGFPNSKYLRLETTPNVKAAFFGWNRKSHLLKLGNTLFGNICWTDVLHQLRVLRTKNVLYVWAIYHKSLTWMFRPFWG